MSRHDADLVVVGGGPVGLATAVGAAQQGLSVVVLDPREGPADKACGEGLMPGARASLERLGVRLRPGPDAHEMVGIRYLSPGHVAEARFRAGPGLGVRRTVLSAALQARAEEVGVVRERVRAGTPVDDGDGVLVGGLRARWCVAADGLHSPTRRALGLDVPPPRRPAGGARPDGRRFGLRRHYRTAPWGSHVDVLWSRDAEAYVTPVAPDVVGVAVLTSADGDLDSHLARFPGLAARLAGVPHASTTRGAGPLRQVARRRVAGRVLLVGDAAGYVDALTGEGIAVGLACAREAVACVVADDASSYERRWHAASRRYRLLTEGLLAASSVPVLRRGLVPAAERLPRLFGAVVDRLA
ncbi:NAD(P)/FAD-dependent oxidoreductase [Aquipuribacter hungaricus]|uniref:NAD(P)/FAD-dependent oxidoreductase n=1 Tax=Aquipuribacter hungaricus TaxID=545624 RepID=A0ABV7WI89_9MICO